MTTAGIFLRQYLGQTATSGPSDWEFSPDLMVFGTEAAYSTNSFVSVDSNYASYQYWYFSQAPTAESANYVYVRGLNKNPEGVQSSTVYFFYATEETLLQPSKWGTDTFSMTDYPGGGKPPSAPVARNTLTLSSFVYNSFAISYDTDNQVGSLMTWTPPTAGEHYYLIAWIDNSGSDKPPFAAHADFTTKEELGKFIQKNEQMVFLDTLYQGIYLRQNPSQTTAVEPNGDMTSPDIIVTNNEASPDFSQYATTDSYDKTTLNQAVTYQQRNFIYLRALNTSGGAQNGRVYFYYATSDQLSPTGWRTDSFTVGGRTTNFLDFKSTKGGEILVSEHPIVWSVNYPTSEGAYYVLITYVDNSPEPSPPDFATFGYVNILAIKQFVATQPRMSWLELKGTAATQPDMSFEFPLSFKASTEPQYVGLQFENISTEGKVTFSVPGSDATNTLIQSNMPVTSSNAAVVWPLVFSQDFDTSLVLDYWGAGGTGKYDINAVVLEKPTKAKKKGSK